MRIGTSHITLMGIAYNTTMTPPRLIVIKMSHFLFRPSPITFANGRVSSAVIGKMPIIIPAVV